MSIEQGLREFGLLDKEIHLYLALLPLGEISVYELVRHIEYPRATLYGLLEQLMKKGIVGKIVKNKVAHYFALDPERLADIMEQRKEIVHSIVPNLHELQLERFGGLSGIEICYGNSNVHKYIESLIERHEEVSCFGNYEVRNELAHYFIRRLIPLADEYQTRIRIISSISGALALLQGGKSTRVVVRGHEVLEKYSLFVYCTEDKAILFDYSAGWSLIILKQKSIAKAFSSTFEFYWNSTEAKIF